MKTLVRINTPLVSSKFGYIVEEADGMALIKVGCKDDVLEWLCEPHCIILGSTLYEKI